MIFNDPFLVRSAMQDIDYDMIYDGDSDTPTRKVKRTIEPQAFMDATVEKVHLPKDSDHSVDYDQLRDDEDMLWDALYNLCGKFCK